MSNLQGTELDLQGTVKPKAYGSVSNALPKLVNPNRQIYELGGVPSALYDGGATITAGTVYPDLLTLRSTAPSAGQYRAFQERARLGAVPTKEVTCDVFGGYAYNADFERGAVGWSLLGGSAIVADAANALTGSYVFTRTDAAGGEYEIGRNDITFEVTAGKAYPIGGSAKCSTAAGGAGQIEVGFAWLNSAQTEIAASRHVWTPATGYVTKQGAFIAPVGAAYARVSIVGRFQTTGTWYMDSITGVGAGLGDVFFRVARDAGFEMATADLFAANASGDVGIYLAEQTPTVDLLDLLVNSYGGYYALVGSEIQLKQLAVPASPTFSIEDYEDLEVSRDATGAGENGLPVWRVVVKGDRVEHVQTDVNGAANPARLKTEYREAVWESPAVQLRHPLSPQLTLVTCLRNLSDMQALANRIGALFSVRRDTVRVRATFSPSNVAKLSAALRIGAVCRLTSSYLGYEAGRDMTVIAFEFDVQRTVANFTLWG